MKNPTTRKKLYTVSEMKETNIVIYRSHDAYIEVRLYLFDDAWWIKIIHVGSAPDRAELNFSSDRVDTLNQILSAIKRRTKDIPTKVVTAANM